MIGTKPSGPKHVSDENGKSFNRIVRMMKPKLPSNYLIALAIFTAFDLVILTVREIVEHSSEFQFLLWNLFLAFVPLAVAWVTYVVTGKWATWLVVLLSIVWLLFYPNAPYMISDLIHVDPTNPRVL